MSCRQVCMAASRGISRGRTRQLQSLVRAAWLHTVEPLTDLHNLWERPQALPFVVAKPELCVEMYEHIAVTAEVLHQMAQLLQVLVGENY